MAYKAALMQLSSPALMLTLVTLPSFLIAANKTSSTIRLLTVENFKYQETGALLIWMLTKMRLLDLLGIEAWITGTFSKTKTEKKEPDALESD